MTEDVKKILKEFQVHFVKMRADIPETRNAILDLTNSVHKDGALSRKHKELICAAISLYARCEPCIVHHVRRSIQAGATREEIMEACGAAILMGGGTVVTFIDTVIKSIEAFQ